METIDNFLLFFSIRCKYFLADGNCKREREGMKNLGVDDDVTRLSGLRWAKKKEEGCARRDGNIDDDTYTNDTYLQRQDTICSLHQCSLIDAFCSTPTANRPSP
jgi:hypothetical protein